MNFVHRMPCVDYHNIATVLMLTRITHEKEKYMKLAEFEAETICNLEKENFKLSDALNSAEEKLENEREKNKYLENDLMVNFR